MNSNVTEKTDTTGKESNPVLTESSYVIHQIFTELHDSVYTALKTYSNVHRGSGHFSIITTHLFEKARKIVLEYSGYNEKDYEVIFCSPYTARKLKTSLASGSYRCVSSWDIGLSLGVRALIVKRSMLPKGAPVLAGGGTARLISRNWVVWAKKPAKYEAGTPSIINIITFAKALQLKKQYGIDTFRKIKTTGQTAKNILYDNEWNNITGLEFLNELRKTLTGNNIEIPTARGFKPYINLDNGASTPTFDPVWDSASKSWNLPEPQQQNIIEEVKLICSEKLNAPVENYDIIFTTNTTESINIVSENLQKESNNSDTVIVNSLLEHNSNELPWRINRSNVILRLSIDPNGFINLNELELFLKQYNAEKKYGNKRIKLVTVNGASNVLGSFNNISAISKIAHEYNAHILVDGAQLVAHRKIDMEKDGIDYLVFSAHKMYAPFGTGVLVARKELLNFNNEETEIIKLSGEENICGIAALGKSFLLLHQIGMNLIENEEKQLTAYTLNKLSVIPGIRIFGIKNPDIPEFGNKGGVIVFILKNTMPDQTAKKLALSGGIGVRYGCHCSHILVKHLHKIPSGLEKFQRLIVTLFPSVELPGVVRISLGIQNKKEEIDKLAEELKCIAEKNIRNKNNSENYGIKNKPLNEVKKEIKLFVSEFSRNVFG